MGAALASAILIRIAGAVAHDPAKTNKSVAYTIPYVDSPTQVDLCNKPFVQSRNCGGGRTLGDELAVIIGAVNRTSVRAANKQLNGELTKRDALLCPGAALAAGNTACSGICVDSFYRCPV